MRNFPLNKQLLDLNSTFVQTARTAKKYKLFKLSEMKPGLVLQQSGGSDFEVEIWDIPEESVGSFLSSGVAAPLALGKVHMEDGSLCPGFVCESGGLETDSIEISQYHGWRDFKEAQQNEKIDLSSMSSLRNSYLKGLISPKQVALKALSRIHSRKNFDNAFITVAETEFVQAQVDSLEGVDPLSKPLFGIPFVVKDNIDVKGMPTTAACPDYAYHPSQNATVVQRLLDAGAICLGKTNLDQFATGLVGTRSPYGAVKNAYNPTYVSGGSSSGSAVAVANKLACFSLGTDTAGSGRIPAAFNKLVGLKPTVGSVSNTGVVPACKSLDVVTVFGQNCGDCISVYDVMRGFDDSDEYSLSEPEELPAFNTTSFRFGVPTELEFFGNARARENYFQSVEALSSIGGIQVPIDYTPFRETAEMLYQGPWVAERYNTIYGFEGELDPTVGKVISSAKNFDARDAFRYMYKLQKYKRITSRVWDDIDFMVTPTAGTIYTIEELQNNPIQLNTNLGYYTNFMNLLNLCGVAVPAGELESGPHFGITFASQPWKEASLCCIGEKFMALTKDIKRN